MKGLIIIGYQGIGKTSIGGQKGCIDLESSNFYIDEKRDKSWYKIYCKIALDLANQGYTVFTSSHQEVRDYFAKEINELPKNVASIVIFCPKLTQKKEWIERLQERYDRTQSEKDKRALKSAIENFDSQIRDLVHSNFRCYSPDSIDYDLHDYVFQMQYDWCLNLDE